jgi:flagellar basal-body rod modification protein FlgD
MAVEAIGIVNQGDASVPQAAVVNQTEFLNILLTQLRFQDPLKPMDNQQFVAQLAQFSALELNRQQAEKIDSLLQINSTGQAIGLLGQKVEVRNVSNGVGEVTAVSFATGQPALTVMTATGQPLVNVSLSDVVLVQGGE